MEAVQPAIRCSSTTTGVAVYEGVITVIDLVTTCQRTASENCIYCSTDRSLYHVDDVKRRLQK